MATYTVTTGNDTTAYTVSTGARGPKGDDGGVGTTEDVLGLLQGSAADPTRIGAEYMPAPVFSTIPSSAAKAYAKVDLFGSNVDFWIVAKTAGASANGITFNVVVSGSQIAFSNVGNAYTATVPSGTISQSLVDAINADSSLPFKAVALQNVSGAINVSMSAKTLTAGSNGTSGTLGEIRFVDVGDGQVLKYEMVSINPIMWVMINYIYKVETTTDASDLRVGDGFDKLVIIGSGPTTALINLPTSLVTNNGQVFSVVSTAGIGAVQFSNNFIIEGTSVTTFLPNVIYSFVCTNNEVIGNQVWRNLQ